MIELSGAALSLAALVLAPIRAPHGDPAPLAISGGIVHTLVPGEVPRVATVLVVDGRVAAVGSAPELPAGTEVLDATGLHVVPGLIDALVHFDPAHDALYVASGVTLVRDAGADPAHALAERAPSARAVVPGPELLAPGPVLAGTSRLERSARIVSDRGAAERAVQGLADLGVDFVAVHDSLAEEPWRGVVEAAHARGLKVWGPRPIGLSIEQALEGAQDGFHHLDSLLPPSPELTWEKVLAFRRQTEVLAARGAPLVPVLSGLAYRLAQQSPDDPVLELLSPSLVAWWRSDLAERAEVLHRQPELEESLAKIVEKQAELLASLHDAGARLVPGSAAPSPWIAPGRGLVEELILWQEAGVPARDVLAAATREAAAALGLPDRGAIAPGAVADLVLVPCDPEGDVRALLDPRAVVVRGQALSRESLDDLVEMVRREQRAEQDRARAPLALEAPRMPPGLPLLAGQVEAHVRGLRVAAERFAIVLCEDERVAYCGRVFEPAMGDGPPREWHVTQWTRDGLLDEFLLGVEVAGDLILCGGKWIEAEGRMVVVRERDGELLSRDYSPPDQRPRLVGGSSVTSALVLGHLEARHLDAGNRVPVLFLREELEPEIGAWTVAWEPDATHKVQVQAGGGMVVEFRENGGIGAWLTSAGRAEMLVVPVGEEETFGGGGWPIPPGKLEAAGIGPPASAAAGSEDDPAEAPPVGGGA